MSTNETKHSGLAPPFTQSRSRLQLDDDLPPKVEHVPEELREVRKMLQRINEIATSDLFASTLEKDRKLFKTLTDKQRDAIADILGTLFHKSLASYIFTMILDAPDIEIGGKRYSDEWRENLRRQGKDSHDVAYECLANWQVFTEDIEVDESDNDAESNDAESNDDAESEDDAESDDDASDDDMEQ